MAASKCETGEPDRSELDEYVHMLRMAIVEAKFNAKDLNRTERSRQMWTEHKAALEAELKEVLCAGL